MILKPRGWKISLENRGRVCPIMYFSLNTSSSPKYRTCLLRSILHPLHVSDASWILRPVHEKERKTDVDAAARCELVKVPNPRGYRRRGSCARHGPVDSINGNNATSVRRFIDDAIELRRPSPPLSSPTSIWIHP